MHFDEMIDSNFSGSVLIPKQAWQLVKKLLLILHQPQIHYRLSEDKYLGDDVQELYENSVSPVTERYHIHNVFPAVCRCQITLVKGMVYLSQFSEETYI